MCSIPFLKCKKTVNSQQQQIWNEEIHNNKNKARKQINTINSFKAKSVQKLCNCGIAHSTNDTNIKLSSFTRCAGSYLKGLSHQFEFSWSGLVGQSKIGDEPLMAFKFFCYASKFSLSLVKLPFVEEINKKCLKYVESRWTLGRRGFLVSYWLETRRELHPLSLQSSLAISQRVANTF